MDGVLAFAFVQEPGHRGCRLGDHAHAAIADGVAGKAFPGEGLNVARHPLRLTPGIDGDQGPRGAVLAFGRHRRLAPEQDFSQIHVGFRGQRTLMRGRCKPRRRSSVNAHTNASSRSGLPSPSRASEHISSSRSANAPT